MPRSPRPSRRAVVLGGTAALLVGGAGVAVGVEQGVLPGRPLAQRLLGLDGEAGVVPDVVPGPVARGSLTSAHRPGVASSWVVARPPDVEGPLPVVVALHGLGTGIDDLVGAELGLPEFLAAAVATSTPPFALAAVDGGRSYWREQHGSDTGAMVVDDFLPLLASKGLSVERIGLLGWSMGGYGALRLAAVLGPTRCAAVVAVSPAIWDDPADASHEGFADAADYEHATVQGHQDELAGIAVRVDCGTGDPFYRPAQDYAAALPDGEAHFAAGAHAAAYWRRVLPSELSWLGSRVGPA